VPSAARGVGSRSDDHAQEAVERQSNEEAMGAWRSTRTQSRQSPRSHRENWCVPKRCGLHFAALDGPVFHRGIGAFFQRSIDDPSEVILRYFVLVLSLFVLAGCATTPNSDTPSYRTRDTATGSNIPRHGSADVVDKDSVDDLRNRTSGISLKNGS
jgi:hypothetical protein